MAQAVETAAVKGSLERVRGARPGEVQPTAEIGGAPVRQAKFVDDFFNFRQANQSLGMQAHLGICSRRLGFAGTAVDNQGLKERFDLQFALLGPAAACRLARWGK